MEEKTEHVPFKNKTTIVWDENLLSFLDKMKEEFKYQLEFLGYPKHAKETYPLMHEYIKDRIYILNHVVPYNPHKHRKPNNYAIFIALCSEYRKYKDWDELSENVINVSIPLDENEEVLDPGGQTAMTCCCSHSIVYCFNVHLKDTRMKLIAGDTCILKNLLVNEDVVAKVKQLKKSAQKLAKLKKTHRMCADCQEWNIKLDEPYWKKRCLSCWRIWKSNERSDIN